MADKYPTALYCVLGGLGVGLAIGVLFAPDSGTGTRDRIRRKANEARGLVTAKADEAGGYLKRQGARLIDQSNETRRAWQTAHEGPTGKGHPRGRGGKDCVPHGRRLNLLSRTCRSDIPFMCHTI